MNVDPFGIHQESAPDIRLNRLSPGAGVAFIGYFSSFTNTSTAVAPWILAS